jgi:hypothetical protein
MKTAIIISGHARSFRWVAKNQIEQLFSRVPDPHFFISVIEDAHSGSLEALRSHFPHVKIEYIPSQPDCVGLVGKRLLGENALRTEVESYLRECASRGGYRMAPHANAQTVFGSLWHQQRAFRMAEGEFDCYVRHRPDLHFVHLDVPVPAGNELYSPWWSAWGGINDRFGIMGKDAAKTYFNQFDQLASMLQSGVALHPESLSGAAMKRGGVSMRPLNVDFSAVRPPDATGQLVQVQPNYSVTDIYNLVQAMR